MKLLSSVFTMALATAAVVATAAFNEAAAIPFSVSDPVGGAGASAEVNFTSFDPVGGAPVSITFTLSGSASLSGASVTGGFSLGLGGGTASAVIGVNLTLALVGGPTIFTGSLPDATPSCAAGLSDSSCSSTPVPVTTLSTNGSFSINDPVVLATLVGGSPKLRFTVETLATSCSALDLSGVPADLCITQGTGDWSGDVTVSLLAIAPPTPAVPAPATLALLGAGMLGLGALRRRSI